MKIEIITSNAAPLKEKIFKAASDKKLETWEVKTSTMKEKFLTPVTSQYNGIVLIKFTIDAKTLNLIASPTHWDSKETPSDAQYAIVIGMFTATLLTHFTSDFAKLETTK